MIFPEFTSSISIAEVVWFIGIIIFSAVVLLGKNKGRGPLLNVGAIILIISYSGMLREYMLSFTEISILQWGIRVGITFILFDLAKRTEVANPIQGIKKILKRGKNND